MAVFVTLAARSIRITLEAATRHDLVPVWTFLRAGGKLGLDRAQYRETELRLHPDAWFCLSAFAHLLKHGAEVRKTHEGFDISLASGRTFELPSESLLPSALAMLDERFDADEYGDLDVSGAVVIDVGAYIGDSAVYFADKGAVHVYAFEPFPETYAAAVRAVRRNRMEQMVTVSPRGVGARNGRGTGFYDLTFSHSSTHRPTSDLASIRAEDIELVPLPSVLEMAREHYPRRPLVLKMDCEGCEFEGFEAEGIRESLKAVKAIVLEVHHDGCHHRDHLWKKLEECGFSVQELNRRRRRVSVLLAEREEIGESPQIRDRA